MDIVDLIIFILLVASLVRGGGIGSVRQILSTAGFLSGLFLGAWLQPHFVHFAHTAASRAWLTLIITLGFGLILLSVGEYVGVLIKKKLLKNNGANAVDSGFGSLIGGAMLLVTVWLGTAALINLPFPALQTELKGSAIISFLDKNLPAAPNVIADLSHVIDPNGFPQVFINGTEPAPLNPNVKLPSLGVLNAAVTKDEASVVKIEGDGCGGIVEGSGFIVSPGLIATNAHVVAGVAHPYVLNQQGEYPATVIWFDPNLDFAVLKITDLFGTPLNLDGSTARNNTDAAVLGYPGGGNFNAVGAVILDEFTATGKNIYDEGSTNRSIYEIKATVIPGNSGGPLVTTNGSVIGIVFAESTDYNQVGYALTMQPVINELSHAEKNQQPVSTGACAG